ncbi:MAG: hypothetical protein Q7T87_22095 [Polaromonas sp.]|nr:hypothetical protein [Polaromonas sp.]
MFSLTAPLTPAPVPIDEKLKELQSAGINDRGSFSVKSRIATGSFKNVIFELPADPNVTYPKEWTETDIESKHKELYDKEKALNYRDQMVAELAKKRCNAGNVLKLANALVTLNVKLDEDNWMMGKVKIVERENNEFIKAKAENFQFKLAEAAHKNLSELLRTQSLPPEVRALYQSLHDGLEKTVNAGPQKKQDVPVDRDLEIQVLETKIQALTKEVAALQTKIKPSASNAPVLGGAELKKAERELDEKVADLSRFKKAKVEAQKAKDKLEIASRAPWVPVAVKPLGTPDEIKRIDAEIQRLKKELHEQDQERLALQRARRGSDSSDDESHGRMTKEEFHLRTTVDLTKQLIKRQVGLKEGLERAVLKVGAKATTTTTTVTPTTPRTTTTTTVTPTTPRTTTNTTTTTTATARPATPRGS